MTKAEIAQTEEAAERIVAMIQALRSKGLHLDHAVTLVAAMLSSMTQYIPLVVGEGGSSQVKH